MPNKSQVPGSAAEIERIVEETIKKAYGLSFAKKRSLIGSWRKTAERHADHSNDARDAQDPQQALHHEKMAVIFKTTADELEKRTPFNDK